MKNKSNEMVSTTIIDYIKMAAKLDIPTEDIAETIARGTLEISVKAWLNCLSAEDIKSGILKTTDKVINGKATTVVANTAENFLNIFRNDEKFAGVRFNTLTGAPEKHRGGKAEQWTDTDDSVSRNYVEAEYGISNIQKYEDAFAEFLREREYCPIMERIEAIEWDGYSRVERFLCKWLGAEDTPYNRECSRLLFAGGINRAYRPGCKFDDVIVLVGSQGGGKSTLCRWLALDEKLYSSTKTIQGQKGYEMITGKWICEFEELLAIVANDYSGMRSEEAVKAFISTQSDYYRKPYDKRPTDTPRRCIFVGTTNRTEFLTDKTGNRRWFPVTTHSKGSAYIFSHEAEIKEYIAQCWAEMKYAFDNGDKLANPFEKPELLDEIRAKQSEAEHEDWREGVIEEYLNGKTRTCVIDVWENALNNPYTKPTRKESNEIVELLRKMGWEKGYSDRFGKYGSQKVFLKRNPSQSTTLIVGEKEKNDLESAIAVLEMIEDF